MTLQTPPQAPVACSQCGRMFSQSDLVQIAGNSVCGDCKTKYLNRVMAGGPLGASSLEYAGVGIRFGARMIDGLVFGIPGLIVVFLLMPGAFRATTNRPTFFNGTFLVFFLVFALFYEVLMLRYWGATVGKMACGLKVVRADGSPLNWGVSVGRYCMYNVISAVPLLNAVLLPTTAIMAATDKQKRGLHDRVCDTRAVHKRSLA